MPDREKVMQWLETCVSGCEEGCPYEYKNLVYRVECKADLMRDTLALLKEQEPKLVRYTASTVRCPNCNKQITTKGCIHREINYCWKCGQAVKWDE